MSEHSTRAKPLDCAATCDDILPCCLLCRYENHPNLNLADWMPAGGQPHVSMQLGAHCGPTSALGDATDQRSPTMDQSMIDLIASGQHFETPLVDEPGCTLPHCLFIAQAWQCSLTIVDRLFVCLVRTGSYADSGVFLDSLHALRDVQSPTECQQYCAATPNCAHFSFVNEGAFLKDYRTFGNTCTLKGEANISGAEGDLVNMTIKDDAFVWGSKPRAIDVDVPGGSLLLDAPLLAPRGWAQGPTSPGMFAFLTSRATWPERLEASSAAQRTSGQRQQSTSVKFVLSFSFAASSCDAFASASPTGSEAARGNSSSGGGGGGGGGGGNGTHSTSGNSCASAPIPQLGMRELALTDDGWLEILGRGAAASPTFAHDPVERRRRMHASRHTRGAYTARTRPTEPGVDGRGIGCAAPLLVSDQHYPVCARLKLAAPLAWDPSSPSADDVSDAARETRGGTEIYEGEQRLVRERWPSAGSPGAAGGSSNDENMLAGMTRVPLAERLWPLHLAPLPPECFDASDEAAMAQGLSIGVVPPPRSCEAAAAAGLCHHLSLRRICSVSCLVCVPSSFDATFLGFEPPPVEVAYAPYMSTVNATRNATNATADGMPSAQTDGMESAALARSAAERLRFSNSSRALAAAASLLGPLVSCDAPQPAFISYVDPTSAPHAGGLAITLYGSGFEAPARCNFGLFRYVVAAQNVTAHRMVCISPPTDQLMPANMSGGAAGRRLSSMAIGVSSGHPSLDWPSLASPSGLRWSRITSYNASISHSLRSIQPAGAPISGGTMVMLRGERLLMPPDAANRAHLRCHFEPDAGDDGGGASDEMTTPATIMSTTAGRCRAPATSSPGRVWLGLRYAGMASAAARVAFTYFTMPNASVSITGDGNSPPNTTASTHASHEVIISAVHPIGGSSVGGTTITLYGTGLIDRGGADPVTGSPAYGMYCRFEPPAERSESGVERVRAAAEALRIAEERVEALKQEAFAAATFADPTVYTEMKVEARRARLASKLRAAAEDVWDAQGVLDSLQAQGFDENLGEASLAKLPGFSLATPLSNSSTSHDLNRSSSMNAKESHQIPAAASSHAVTCVTPPLPPHLEGSPTQIIASVQLVVNADASALTTSSARYLYYPAGRVRLLGTEPSGGPTTGGTLLTLYLRSPQPLPPLVSSDGTSIGVQCRFGAASVPARLLPPLPMPPPPPSDSPPSHPARPTPDHFFAISCVSPAVEALVRTGPLVIGRNSSGDVAITASLNGQDVVHRPALRWLYYPQHRVVVSELRPRGGPTAGGTVVSIRGWLFRQVAGPRGMLCRFGPHLPAVPATWISFEEVMCRSPTLNATSSSSTTTSSNSSGQADAVTGEADSNANASRSANNIWHEVDVCVSLNGDLNACAGAAASASSFSPLPSSHGSYRPGSFAYFDPVRAAVVSKIYPAAGPVAGGTMLSVYGSAGSFRDLNSLRDDGGLRCAFGLGSRTRFTPAAFLADEASRAHSRNGSLDSASTSSSQTAAALITCATPEAESDRGPASLPVHIVLNGDLDEGAVPLAVGTVGFSYYVL